MINWYGISNINIGQLSKTELLDLYNTILDEIESRKQDNKKTAEALDDKRIDYNTKREFQSDIIDNNKILFILENKKREIQVHALINNIELKTVEEKLKQKQKTMNIKEQ